MVHRTIANSPQRSQASVAMGFVTGMLAGVRRRQIDPAPILDALAIDIADTASRIPIDRYAALYNRLNRQLDDEGLRGRAGVQHPPADLRRIARVELEERGRGRSSIVVDDGTD